MSRPVVLGLTGSVGMGKSTVARMFEALGVPVFDADAVVHRLQAPGGALVAPIEAAFPGSTGPRGVGREKLGAAVFADPDALARLEGIVHPAVRAAGREFLLDHTGAKLVVLDIPLLFESRAAGATGGGSALPFEATILVYAPRAVQIARTVARDGCSAAEAEARVAAQMPIDDKRALADHVVDNGGDLTDTERQVEALWRQLTD